MTFFQKSVSLSYGTIAFVTIFGGFTLFFMTTLGDFVFLGFFLGGNMVSAMFLEARPYYDDPTIFDFARGFLIGHEWGKSFLPELAGILSGMLVATVLGMLLTVAHVLPRKIFFGEMIFEKRWIWRRKTFFWNTLLVASTGMIGYMLFDASTKFLGAPDRSLLLIPFVALLIVAVKQNKLNKWATTH